METARQGKPAKRQMFIVIPNVALVRPTNRYDLSLHICNTNRAKERRQGQYIKNMKGYPQKYDDEAMPIRETNKNKPELANGS